MLLKKLLNQNQKKSKIEIESRLHCFDIYADDCTKLVQCTLYMHEVE